MVELIQGRGGDDTVGDLCGDVKKVVMPLDLLGPGADELIDLCCLVNRLSFSDGAFFGEDQVQGRLLNQTEVDQGLRQGLNATFQRHSILVMPGQL